MITRVQGGTIFSGDEHCVNVDAYLVTESQPPAVSAMVSFFHRPQFKTGLQKVATFLVGDAKYIAERHNVRGPEPECREKSERKERDDYVRIPQLLDSKWDF